MPPHRVGKKLQSGDGDTAKMVRHDQRRAEDKRNSSVKETISVTEWVQYTESNRPI